MLTVALAGLPNVVASATLYTTPLPPGSVDVKLKTTGVTPEVDWLLTGPNTGFKAALGVTVSVNGCVSKLANVSVAVEARTPASKFSVPVNPEVGVSVTWPVA